MYSLKTPASKLPITKFPVTAIRRLAAVFFVCSFVGSGHLWAQAICANNGADIDGDGWGWENNNSCIVGAVASVVQTQSGYGQFPQCSANLVDHDNDGWGWEAGRSCVIQYGRNTSTLQNHSAQFPQCSANVVDHENDGWGWEAGRSCLMPFGGSAVQSLNNSGQFPRCSAGVADFDNDGWGMEYGRSCLISAASVPLTNASSANTSSGSGNAGATPVGVRFMPSTLRRVGGKGDNWCQTWAADDSVITAMDDGDWFSSSYRYHSRLYRMVGDQNNFSRRDVANYPMFHTDDDGWFGYGIVSVNGTLYSMVSKTQTGAWSQGPFRGVKMLRSYDNGSSWNLVDQYNNDRYVSAWDPAVQSTNSGDMFFKEEFGRYGFGKIAYPFSYVSFVQNGQDNRASKDGYIYIYAPEVAKSNELLLARVPAAQLGQRSAWQYFSGWNGSQAQWSHDIGNRRANHTMPEKNSSGEYFGWYSWLPSVVWNPGLQLYVMVNGGTYAGHGLSSSSTDYYDKWMHTKTGSLGLWYSSNPWGPWKQFYYTDYWTADDARNLTYQPKLSPKWMSPDGKKMVLIWSDAQRNAQGYSHSVNYKWNQMEIEIDIQ